MAKSSKPKAAPDELAARRAKAAEKREREEAQFVAELTSGLEIATAAEVLEIEKQSEEARQNAVVYKALVSHLAGFYQEVDKLARNKSVFDATDLVVETINDVVRDAKKFAAGDPYLDRTKEFVPAGQNPPYSDVLMVARTVQQFLQRAEQGVLEREKRLTKSLRQAQTVAAALSFWLEGDNGRPTKDDVAERMIAKPVDSWFYDTPDGISYFHYEKLTQRGVRESLAAD